LAAWESSPELHWEQRGNWLFLPVQGFRPKAEFPHFGETMAFGRDIG
jgi:hypothetical protein